MMREKRKTKCATWIILAVLAASLSSSTTPMFGAAEIKLDSLRVGTESFTNVTVLNATDTDVFIQHAGGMANLKVHNLDPQVLAKLLGKPDPIESQETQPASIQNQIANKITQQIANNPEFQQAFGQGWQAGAEGQLPPVPKEFVLVALGIMLFFHFFFSLCAKLIVQKTGHNAGFLIWLPVLQMFPLLRAAGMASWWFLLMLLPILNLIAGITWCFKIVEARGKSVIWAIFLLLPITNFLAFLYLAFSSADSRLSQESGDLPLLRAA